MTIRHQTYGPYRACPSPNQGDGRESSGPRHYRGALYVWGVALLPPLLYPSAAMSRGRFLVDQHQARHSRRGTAYLRGLPVDGGCRPSAARVFAIDAGEAIREPIRFQVGLATTPGPRRRKTSSSTAEAGILASLSSDRSEPRESRLTVWHSPNRPIRSLRSKRGFPLAIT
jgi:hypothetical protein